MLILWPLAALRLFVSFFARMLFRLSRFGHLVDPDLYLSALGTVFLITVSLVLRCLVPVGT